MHLVLALILALGATGAGAQQLYRWVDEKGRVHVTDTPPPPGAREVRRTKPGAKPEPAVEAPTPFVLQRAIKEFPVTLYTSPGCAEPCARARQTLNERGVPFKEVQVWEEEGNAELKRVSGGDQVPTISVGSSVQAGFERAAYDALLDSAGYPRAGVLPSRSQTAPGRPEGYLPPEERAAVKAEPVKPEPGDAPSGPYAPGARPQRR